MENTTKIKYKIKKDDNVMIIAGREKGKTGKVLRVDPTRGKLFISKLNMVKRHQKPSEKHRHGGIIEKEAPLDLSNVMIICAKCKGPVRIALEIDDNGDRTRNCRKCGEVIK